MSLKALHIVFVTACLALAGFLAVWSFMEFSITRSSWSLTGGVASCLSMAALLVYGRFFLKKLKHISYL